jgi:hypothetical protein
MKQLTYNYLVSQIEHGVFHVEHKMPMNPETAEAIYRKYCQLCNIAAPDGPKTYFGFYKSADVWFIHPHSCPRGLQQLARRHLGALWVASNDKATNNRPDANANLRAVIYNALGFRRRKEVIDDPLKRGTPTEKARLIELRPHDKGLYSYKRALGVEIEGTSPLSRRALGEALPYWSNVVNDGSIRTIHTNHEPAEIRMLLNRSTFDQRLHAICKRLNALGFVTNRSCGLHVHMDARHIPFAERRKIQKNMTAWLKLLVELVPESRRDNQYCRLDTKSGRYCAVSIETGGKNTIEARLHSSTTDQAKITMWIRLIELLAVLPAPARKLTNTLAALESLPLCDWDKSFWRARHMQLNPNKYPAGTPAADANE